MLPPGDRKMKLIDFSKNEAGELQDIRNGRKFRTGGTETYHGIPGLKPSETAFLRSRKRW